MNLPGEVKKSLTLSSFSVLESVPLPQHESEMAFDCSRLLHVHISIRHYNKLQGVPTTQEIELSCRFNMEPLPVPKLV